MVMNSDVSILCDISDMRHLVPCVWISGINHGLIVLVDLWFLLILVPLVLYFVCRKQDCRYICTIHQKQSRKQQQKSPSLKEDENMFICDFSSLLSLAPNYTSHVALRLLIGPEVFIFLLCALSSTVLIRTVEAWLLD